MYKLIALLVGTLLLSACNGGGNDTPTTDGMPEPSTGISDIQLQDFHLNIVTGDEKNIDLSRYIHGSDAENFTVSEVAQMSGQTNRCQFQLNEQQKLTVKAQQTGLCALRYSVTENQLRNQSTTLPITNQEVDAVAYLTVQPRSAAITATLPILYYGLTIGHNPHVIELSNALGSEFPTGAKLDEVILFGTGTVTKDMNTNSISYNNGGLGYSRIVYSLTKSDGSTLVGTIDITVGDQVNVGITFDDFEYNAKEVYLNEEVTIDLSTKLTDSSGNNDVSIINVHSLDATVSYTNLKLHFKTSVPGVHNVGVVFKDQEGAYVSGIVTVNVNKLTPDLTVSSINKVFTAPITREQALHHHIDNSGSYKEVADTGPAGTEITVFDLYTAKAYCAARFWSLPTLTQIDAFNTQYSGSLWDKDSASEEDRKWPVGQPYFTDDIGGVDVYMALFASNSFSLVPTPRYAAEGYVTCVK